MAEVKWIKIVTDIFDDEKILLIETLPEADSIIVIWFKLLCLAGKQNNSGVFIMNGKIPYTDNMLATIFRRNENTVKLALETFKNFGMIDIIDNVITIPNWEKHQQLNQLELAREQTRKRVAKHREKQKLLTNVKENENECNVTGNVTVTESNADRIDKIRINKKEKNKKRKTFDDVFAENNFSEKLENAIKDFIDMRKTIKKPMTTKALELLLKNLEKLTNLEDEKIEILNQSIVHGWQTVYPLKQSNVNATENIAKEYKELNISEEEYHKKGEKKYV